MRITAIFLFAICLQVSATGFSQRVTLSEKNAPLKKVLKEVKKQTGYLFFYNDELLPKSNKVSLQVTNVSLQEALDLCFRGQPLTYEIMERTIVIKVRDSVQSANPAPAPLPPSIRVHGIVMDEDGRPLAGISVQVKGTARGTTTDDKGAFNIDMQQGEALVFSSVGYQSRSVTIREAGDITVRLEQAAELIKDAVVIGYGTQRKGSVVGAVDQVKSSDIQGRPVANLVQALQGVSPNLIIQQPDPAPGASININVRGIGTMNDNSPLLVVDGITGGDLTLLNPADIENISILKDAGAAAIYGSRSANGVILVTTKKGLKNSKPNVTYSGTYGMQKSKVLIEPLPAWQNAIFKNESLTNVGQQPIYTPADIRSLKAGGDHEWFLDAILCTAPQQSHNVSVSGGGQNSTYLFSLGGLDQQSNFVGPDYGYKRYNVRLSLTSDYGILKLGGTLSYARTTLKDNTFGNGFLLADAERTPTNYQMKDSLGRYLTNNILTQFNPLGILEAGGYSLNTNDDVFGNINAEIAVTSHFKLRGVFGGNVHNNHGFLRRKQVDFYPQGIYGDDRTTADYYSQYVFTNPQVMAEFGQRFGDHDVNILAGASNESTTAQSSNVTLQYTDSALGIATSGTVVSPGSSTTASGPYVTSLNSVFGRVRYAYQHKYMAEFNFRYDGSSKFAKGKRWGFFPSFSAGWYPTDEKFLEGVRDRVGEIKLRASYGVLGNQSVGNYQYLTTYGFNPTAYGFNNNPVAGTYFSFANADLRWESSATLNAGIDVAILDRKVSFSLDYFNKLTSDILIPPAIPGTFGGSLPDYNAGKMRNRGWEFSVKYDRNGKLFKHHLQFNIADNQNEVMYLQGGQKLYQDAELQTVVKKGVPFNSYVGYKRDGYFQTPDDVLKYPKLNGIIPQPGDIRYKDKNGDGVIDNNDLYVLGNPFPRFTFGFNYTVTYRNIDLGLFFQGVGKRTLFIRGELAEPYQGNYSYNIFKHQLDFWTPTNPNAKYPILSASGSAANMNDWNVGSDLFLYNAAYVRLKNIQLGYSLPQRIAKKLGMQRLRAYFTGQNLLTFTGIKFIDPESTEFNSNMNQAFGNNGSGRIYPTPIFYGGGLEVTF